jgi:DNA-binding IclR family transcriptional regulator
MEEVRTPSDRHERVPRILGAFSSARTTLTLTELAEAAGLPLSTAHRIVARLVEWGALEREGRHYVIGLRLFEIAALAPRAYRLRDRIHPSLEQLLSRTRENVLYSVLDGGGALVVEQLTGHDAVRLSVSLGARLPLHASALGQVMLAFGPPSLMHEVVRQPLAAVTTETITDVGRLQQRVRSVREEAVAVSFGAIRPDAVAIAAPVFLHRSFAGAVAVVMHRATVNVRGATAAVIDAARGISASISASAERPAGSYGRRVEVPERIVPRMR